MGLKERLLEYIKFKGSNKFEFERTVGLSNGFVDKSGNHTRLSSLEKISKAYPDLDILWLRTGEGKMIKSSFHEELSILEQSGGYTVAPLISQYAYAGYLSGFGDKDYIEHQPMYVSSQKYTPGNYVAFEIRGDSMDDGTKRSICENDVVLGRELYREYWSSKLRKDEIFIIVHKYDGICIKEIIEQDLENGIITCHSWNPEYEDFQVKLDDVLQLFYKKELRRK